MAEAIDLTIPFDSRKENTKNIAKIEETMRSIEHSMMNWINTSKVASQKRVKETKKFITDFMFRNRHLADNQEYKTSFTRTISAVYEKLGPKPFHIYRGLNAAVFDSVMVAFSKNLDCPPDIRGKYNMLTKREDYWEKVSASTTDEDTVRERIRIALEVLFG